VVFYLRDVPTLWRLLALTMAHDGHGLDERQQSAVVAVDARRRRRLADQLSQPRHERYGHVPRRAGLQVGVEGDHGRVWVRCGIDLQARLSVQGRLDLLQVVRHIQGEQATVQLLAELAEGRGY